MRHFLLTHGSSNLTRWLVDALINKSQDLNEQIRLHILEEHDKWQSFVSFRQSLIEYFAWEESQASRWIPDLGAASFSDLSRLDKALAKIHVLAGMALVFPDWALSRHDEYLGQYIRRIRHKFPKGNPFIEVVPYTAVSNEEKKVPIREVEGVLVERFCYTERYYRDEANILAKKLWP
jgi:hypothetical protein